jgi:mono/diheme cytochrome c family protein
MSTATKLWPGLLLGTLVAAACNRPAPDPPSSGLNAGATAGGGSAVPLSVRYQGWVNAGGIAPAGGEYKNPFAGDARVAEQGGKAFTAMNCDGCHGVGATGWVGPSLVDGRWRYGGSDGELFQSIYYGRPRGMPAFGGALSPDGIWGIVTWIRSTPPPADVPTEAWK